MTAFFWNSGVSPNGTYLPPSDPQHFYLNGSLEDIDRILDFSTSQLQTLPSSSYKPVPECCLSALDRTGNAYC